MVCGFGVLGHLETFNECMFGEEGRKYLWEGFKRMFGTLGVGGLLVKESVGYEGFIRGANVFRGRNPPL